MRPVLNYLSSLINCYAVSYVYHYVYGERQCHSLVFRKRNLAIETGLFSVSQLAGSTIGKLRSLQP